VSFVNEAPGIKVWIVCTQTLIGCCPLTSSREVKKPPKNRQEGLDIKRKERQTENERERERGVGKSNIVLPTLYDLQSSCFL
jgi:hypothetical protein